MPDSLCEVATESLLAAMKEYEAAHGQDLMGRQFTVANAQANLRVAEVAALVSIAVSLGKLAAIGAIR